MGSETEIELKFLFAPDDLAVLEQSSLIASSLAEAEHQRLKAIYFDTPEGKLWKQGIGLRIRDCARRDGVQRIQTLKCQLSSDLERGEWESPLTGDTPDLTLFDQTPLADFFAKPKIGDSLTAIFTVAVERRSFLLHNEGATIEVALDIGQIIAGSQSSSVHELELELKAGEPAGLLDLARKFQAHLPLSYSPVSKAEHGHMLALGRWALPPKSTNPRLTEDMSATAAFQSIARACLHDYTLSLIALEGPDPIEAVHKGRVALRRLRAAFSLFKPLLADETFPRLANEVRWIARRFGEARDRDVLQTGLFNPAAEAGKIPGSHLLAELMEQARIADYFALAKDIRTARARSFLLDFSLWIEQGAWQHHASQQAAENGASLENFVRPALRERRRKIVRRGRTLVKLTPEARHRLRIAAKKLRYMADFFLDVPSIARNRPSYKIMLEALEKLQASLGELHDQDFKTAFLEAEWPKLSGHDAALFAAGRLSAEGCDDEEMLLNEALEAHATLVKTKVL
ncbi:CYTH and CHAD domain-containing protein [Beijerinckia indica]|uniref:Adenylate cyclase n=1 Tax=Beijerinckia indica subsp. indica (strain ATCC 9039 / DSM 1715 / NCIMB 8712) TaxID=395963 RepID=B2IHT8_BEII9|nr:CYTH and CHAD domain-containing protein [Beijerinckia indica]ACB95981.1 adenylate cyclase [Beijerinckia indica subsp. indica ATCC 9039]